jgi:peptide/nickel transport system ATP-binding protein
MRSPIILDIHDLKITFKTDRLPVTAVDGISFTIEKEHTLGIVGESGSGKSVTALSVLRLLSPNASIDRGSICFNPYGSGPIDLIKLSEKEMLKIRGKDIAMIFQEPMTSLNPVYTCGNQVMEAVLTHTGLSGKEAKHRVLGLFEEVELPRPESVFQSYPHQLSGGQQQRVMIAMAISCNPSLLIADEPTTALDVTIQKTIIRLLKDLQVKHQMSIIFITHDLNLIAGIADDIAVMYKGKIVEKGLTSQILSQPAHPYTRALMACRPSIHSPKGKLMTVADFLLGENDKEEKECTLPENEIAGNDVVNIELNVPLTPLKEEIIRLEDITTIYTLKRDFWGRAVSQLKAVDGISLSVYKGETLGLVGESGCGKSTLGRTILQLIENASGNILFKGRKINGLTSPEMRKVRKDIQIIFQDPYSSLNPKISVGKAITETMKVHGIGTSNDDRKTKAIELLNKVGLQATHFNRYPHEFSGGQRQRVGIARALAVQPQLIICDESVSALDVSVQAQVLNLLNGLKKEFDLTYIFISHDLAVVKYMADRIVVMNNGKIEEMADAGELFAHPASAYTKTLIDAVANR